MPMRRRGLAGLVVVSIIAISSLTAMAQTGPDLLVKPWQLGQSVQTSTDGMLESEGHTKDADEGIRLSTYHAVGRWRILPDNRATPVLGYDVQYWDVTSNAH